MQCLRFWRENQSPVQESTGLAARFLRCLMAIAVVALFMAPRSAHAQFSSGLETLRDALGGNAAAISLIQSELGGSMDVYSFLNVVSTNLGGSGAAVTTINQALGGNAGSLSTPLGALGGESMTYDDGWGWFIPIPQANDLINSIIAGQGEVGLQTMQLLLQGNAGATAVFNILLDGNANILRDTLVSVMGNGNLADAITQMGNAILGNPEALDILNLMVSSANDIWPSLGIDNLGLDFLNLSSPTVTAVPPTPPPAPPAPPPAPPAPPAPPPAPPAPPPFTGDDPPPGPEDNCEASDAPLTGSFAVDPCAWARENSTGTLNTWGNVHESVGGDELINHQAGWQVVEYVRNWWNDQFRPALQNMTAQWHASTIDQSRQLGSMMDSHNVTRQARNLQQAETEAKASLMPNEKTCSAASPPAAMSHGESVSNAARTALTNEVTKEVNNQPSSGTPQETISKDVNKRFETFCQYFLNTQMNDGANPCPNPTTAGEIVDGDIDVETFLFKDTIDFQEEKNRIAATSLLRNLIQPYIVPKLDPQLTQLPEVQEWILKQEHLKSIRTISTDVVTAIMSRRMALPETGELGATMPAPPPPGAVGGEMTAGGGDYTEFLRQLGYHEAGGVCNIRERRNGNFLGMYQMGRQALIAVGCIHPTTNGSAESWSWTGNCGGRPINSMNDYLRSCEAQTGSIQAYHAIQYNNELHACTKARVGTTTANGTVITTSGLVAAAHLVGAGCVDTWMGCPGGVSAANYSKPNRQGGCNPGPDGVPRDGNNHSAEFRLKALAGYDMGFGTPGGPGYTMGPSGSVEPPPPPRPINEIIQEIRRKAGVPDDQIAEFPSYNEIMQALTQERFFDPDYYIRIANNIGALVQEQTIVNAYITLQLQDIYKLQEQINALVAARAALQLNQQMESGLVNEQPANQ